MQTNNPIAIDNNIYNELLINLAVSSRPKPGFIGAAVSLQTIPVHRTAEGEFLTAPESARSYISGDVYQENDPALQKCVGAIYAALQEFILTKNL
jgi:hypothetical protein